MAQKSELEGLVLVSTFFPQQSQWECHLWLCGNNLTMVNLGQFLNYLKLGGKRFTHICFQSGPMLNQKRDNPKMQICYYFFTWVVIKISSSLKWDFCTLSSFTPLLNILVCCRNSFFQSTLMIAWEKETFTFIPPYSQLYKLTIYMFSISTYDSLCYILSRTLFFQQHIKQANGCSSSSFQECFTYNSLLANSSFYCPWLIIVRILCISSLSVLLEIWLFSKDRLNINSPWSIASCRLKHITVSECIRILLSLVCFCSDSFIFSPSVSLIFLNSSKAL